jgi:phosphatidylserine/phosphatidylglycerophosphate/cardiolipin synthase-like enzyme
VSAKLIGGSKTLHAKLVVIDGRWSLFGSTNWSASSMNFNNETDFLVDSAPVAGRLKAYVDKLWSSGAKATLDPGPYDGLTLAGDTQYPDVALPVIAAAGAGSRVRVIMYQVNYDTGSDAGALVRALGSAKTRGADVKVMLELSSFSQSVTSANQKARDELESRGVEVRLDTADVTTHAKLVVVDDTVVIASSNWTDASLSSNHEVAGVYTDATIATQASAYFDGIWATGQ